MNKKHKQEACGCLLMSLLALGIVICAVSRIAQEIQKRTNKKPVKTEQRETKIQASYRIMPSNCR